MSGLIPTKASQLKGVQKVEEVTFVSYKSKKKFEKVQETQQKENSILESDKNAFKKAKNDVIKFALSNLQGQDKRSAKMQLAIKLGAKPPRNKFRNYKELMEQRKKEKQQEEEKLNLAKIGKNSIGESIARTNKVNKLKNKQFKKKKGDDILGIYGTVKKVVNKEK